MNPLTKRVFIKYAALTGLVAITSISSVMAVALLSDTTVAESEQAQSKAKSVQYLFVQTAHAITSKDNQLTLHGIGPATLFFSDRPERITGHVDTEGWVKSWSVGKDSFAANPPNATISILGNDSVDDVVVELTNPQLVGSKLTYTVKVLEGNLPASGGIASLFIDIIGMPMTPLSYRGVERRAVYRRAVWR
ncbi:hypothetical protein AU255_18490 [Methyloprofundus sedimenti]|uniref:Uncharacterized protein n=1 Tax=Methyloprofundus sedimenti TaxID=1420851 RepID=A0A1V8M153_9GAMM|nr:hypothetical protein [Methyloprofundus sedimenti]OQK15153.1 hypothetical protein AU255_18490 [Methyloprofundus sedimenti]